MNVYTHSTYKDFFRSYIEANQQKGIISQVAAACGCDRTYLSQVLNGKAELTPDHLVQFTDSMGFSDTEARYLLLMLLRDRASSPAARRSFQERIDKLKQKAFELSKNILHKEKPGQIREELRTLYYSTWMYSAVHILTSIPDFQHVGALSEKLQQAPVTISRVLKDLIEMHLVRREKDRYVHTGNDIYLSREHSQLYSHHLNWRMKAVERSMAQEDVHYTTAFTISKKDIEKLRVQILELIESQRKTVRSSGTEAAFAFCCDFFAL